MVSLLEVSSLEEEDIAWQEDHSYYLWSVQCWQGCRRPGHANENTGNMLVAMAA